VEWGISLKNKPEQTGKRNEKTGRQTSLVSHISAFYTKMVATWLFVSLLVIFLLVMAFNIFFMVMETQPAIDRLNNITDADTLIRNINSTSDANLVLLDEMDQIKASSFSEASHITDAGLPGFHQYNNRIYFNYIRNFQLTDGQEFLLAIYYDITMLLFEMTVLGAAAILLFLISMLIIYIRGNYLTRKAFGVVDEMIVKAGNISSQNLNLRLNVNDSTDELVEFALTFNGMMDRIEKAYEKQKQFVSDASHELRTPIAVIQGYARMLDRWGKDDKAILQESIDAISKESKNMQDLVDKLLFIARNDKDTLVLVKNKFNMSELVQELIRETKMLETNHEIGGSVTPDVILDGDRDQIKQALRIFVDNAIKYTKPGGAITISLQVEDGSAVATVRDTGMGIPEKELPNIFDRFYRVDAARERDIGGHGLGLSIARIIILRHGGCIKVASKLGGGTRFRIYLPMVEPEVQS
jgi:signal transduction histidine kinase